MWVTMASRAISSERVSPIHQEIFSIAKEICKSLRGHDKTWDIINWVESQEKKKRLPRRMETSFVDPLSVNIVKRKTVKKVPRI